MYQYEFASALEAGFTVGSVKTEGNYRLLVMDTARSAKFINGSRAELWGFGYRFLVEVSDVSLVGKLTLPAIAASMEITQMEATVRLEVKGYNGDDMWGVIPAPKPLDIDTYATYLSAVENIQKAFGTNPDNAYPVLLAVSGVDDIEFLIGGVDVPDLEAATVLVWALGRMRDGAPLEVASEAAVDADLPLPDKVGSLLNGAYAAFGIASDPAVVPDEALRARVGDLLSSLDYR